MSLVIRLWESRQEVAWSSQVDMAQVVECPTIFEKNWKDLLKETAGISLKLKVGSCAGPRLRQPCGDYSES